MCCEYLLYGQDQPVAVNLWQGPGRLAMVWSSIMVFLAANLSSHFRLSCIHSAFSIINVPSHLVPHPVDTQRRINFDVSYATLKREVSHAAFLCPFFFIYKSKPIFQIVNTLYLFHYKRKHNFQLIHYRRIKSE